MSLQFTDVMGTIKNVTVPVTELAEALEKGIWFDGSTVEGFTRIAESDMYLMPDVHTYQVLPWSPLAQRTARLICDVLHPDGQSFSGDPRFVLRSALAACQEMGYTYHVSSELEFFLFTMLDDRPSTAPAPHDVASYFDFSPRDLASDVRQDIILGLESIKHKLTPPPVEENVYDFSDEKLRNLSIDTLPGSLIEALGKLERDEVLRGTLAWAGTFTRPS